MFEKEVIIKDSEEEEDESEGEKCRIVDDYPISAWDAGHVNEVDPKEVDWMIVNLK